MDFRPLQTTPSALEDYRKLFDACFPSASGLSPAYLEWLYAANPDGPAQGFDAWEGARLAAHYVCVPASARIEGNPVRVLLSLNTATHPDFQGKGLFTRLAGMTYAAAKDAGFDSVYGVANANSTPGFVRKLGFQLVRPLEARVGFGRLRHNRLATPLAFERDWSEAALAWRCASPRNPVRLAHGRAYARAFGSLLPAFAQIDDAPDLAPAGAAWRSPLHLYLGLEPDADAAWSSYVRIPQTLRPSPLNLIYKSLSGAVEALDPTRIRFSFLDFDAY